MAESDPIDPATPESTSPSAAGNQGSDGEGSAQGVPTAPTEPSSGAASGTPTLDLADAAARVQRTSALTPLTSRADDDQGEAAPVGFSFPSLGVETATVRPVGVEPNGELEVPPESEVGWYRYSPVPGEAGSSVLAGHVNYDGRDGVFRFLTEVEVGDEFFVDYADGTTRPFVVSEVAQYDKTGLPNDRIFARTGDAEVALITCGGTFDYDERSYEDNVVVYGVPQDL